MKKNRMDQRGEIGSFERASGYTINASPKPTRYTREGGVGDHTQKKKYKKHPKIQSTYTRNGLISLNKPVH